MLTEVTCRKGLDRESLRDVFLAAGEDFPAIQFHAFSDQPY